MNKIIEAYLKAGKTANTAPVWQYDYGQLLHINGIALPASYKAEFSNTARGDAVATVQTTDTVAIPAQFLESGNPVYIWLVVVDESSRTTEYALIVPVAARAKPTDTEPTPEEQSEIDQTLAALNSAVEKTAADAEATGADALRAENAADAAEDSANTVVGAKDAALAAQEAAEMAETNAEGFARRAEEAERGAMQSARSAEESARNAARDADRAEQAAADAGYMFFYIDGNGDLIYQRTSNTQVDFYLDDGDLYVEAIL